MSPVKVLLSTILLRLKLNGKPFEVFTAAKNDDLKRIWSRLGDVDPGLEYGHVYRKSSLKNIELLS